MTSNVVVLGEILVPDVVHIELVMCVVYVLAGQVSAQFHPGGFALQELFVVLVHVPPLALVPCSLSRVHPFDLLCSAVVLLVHAVWNCKAHVSSHRVLEQFLRRLCRWVCLTVNHLGVSGCSFLQVDVLEASSRLIKENKKKLKKNVG